MRSPVIVPEDLRNGAALRRSWARAIASHAIARSNGKSPDKIIEATWPRDTVAKAATSPTARANFPARDTVAAFQALMPGSAAMQLFGLGVTLDLLGQTTIRIPHLSGLPVQPVFVGEGMPIPSTQWSFAQTVCGPARKLAILSAISAELDDATAETAAAVVAKVLADATGKSIDTFAFGGQTDDGITCAGLLHGAVPIVAAPAGPDAMSTDLSNLIDAIAGNGIATNNAIFVASPREAMTISIKVGSSLFDARILSSLGLPSKTICAFAPGGVISGWRDPPTIEVAREAVIHFESAVPADIVNASGTPAVPSKSMFQSDILSIRVKAYAAWACASGAAQIVQNVNW